MERVTVGMPMYNDAQTLERAIRSILDQTVSDIRVVISDNCSTDGTEAICRRIAAEDSRISYFRQPKLTDVQENFVFVYEKASTPYFMWAASDDYWDKRFIEENLEVLESSPDVAGSISKVRWTVEGREAGLAVGTYPLEGSPPENIYRYLRNPADNSRIFALYRRESLEGVYPTRLMLAHDWAVAIGVLKHGKYVELSEVLLTRDLTPKTTYLRDMLRYQRAGGFPLFPLFPMTWHVLFKTRIPLTAKIVWALLQRNIDFHSLYAEVRFPFYGRPLRALLRTLGRNLPTNSPIRELG